MKFTVFGDDARSAFAARFLEQSGLRPSAAEEAQFALLPLPSTDESAQLLKKLPRGSLVFAFAPSALVCDTAAQLGLELVDLLEDEALTVMNAALTAQAAVATALDSAETPLLGKKTLVCGFGRIGKLCARYFSALGAQVTASARKPGDLAWIRALGYGQLDTTALDGRLSDFRLIVNTVPACVFDSLLIAQIDRDCLCIDLASKPGGFDAKAKDFVNTRVIHALSLPAKAFGESAGELVKESICKNLKERGLL